METKKRGKIFSHLKPPFTHGTVNVQTRFDYIYIENEQTRSDYIYIGNVQTRLGYIYISGKKTAKSAVEPHFEQIEKLLTIQDKSALNSLGSFSKCE